MADTVTVRCCDMIHSIMNDFSTPRDIVIVQCHRVCACVQWCMSGSGRLTLQEALTLLKGKSIRITLLRGYSTVALCHGHDSSPIPHQKLTQRTVVTRGCTVQWSPVGQQNSTYYIPGYKNIQDLL